MTTEQKEIVNVTVFGKTLKLSCPKEEVENLHKAANTVDERIKKLKEKSTLLPTEHYLIIVSIELAFELNKAQNMDRNDEFSNKLKELQEFLASSIRMQEQ